MTLASALLLGPSLASVQFGSGDLMGPFGHTLGSFLNMLGGLSGYLVVGLLLGCALHIFAGGLGLERGTPLLSLWRQRVGFTMGILFATILLHLGFRPTRIHGASAGGIVGEIGAEVLCAILSTPGAWVISLAGLATAAVLATNFSWAHAGLALGRVLRRAAATTRLALRRGHERLWGVLCELPQLLHREQVSHASDGSAALPPVVRLDLRELSIPHDEPHAPERTPAGMPSDLEIGGQRVKPEPEPRPQIPCLDSANAAGPEDAVVEAKPEVPAVELAEQPAGERPAKKKPEDQAAAKPQAPRDDAPTADAGQTEQEALTIVEPTYRESDGDAESEAEASQEKPVEQTDGPGFVLHGDVYRPPPLSLLEFEKKEETNIDRDAIYRQADKLVKTLADYKILGRVTEVHPGPVVTMYEFKPAPGTRISKVANLANDLAMSLAALRVRIVAPIPGKGTIGIEVPNDQRDTVFFKEIVGHESFRKGKSTLTLALGKNIFGAPVTVDLAKMPHLLVAGATGAGKSVSINAMICSLLLRGSPEEVRLIMVDPKYLELSGYNDIPHLMLPVVTDPTKANTALRWAVREMERRYQLLADMRVRDIRAYNRKVDKLRGAAEAEEAGEGGAETIAEAAPSKIVVVRKNADGSEEPLAGAEPATTEQAEAGAEAASDAPASGEGKRKKARGPLPRRLPYIVVVIDEFADLMMVASKDVETSVARLAQKARAAGIHVILATQRPSVDVITGLIKANFPSRVSFQVASGHDSKTILGTQGAENLLGAGDMLVLDRGAEMKRIHGAYISDGEIQRIIEWLKDQGKPVYDMEILQPKDDEEQPAEQDEDYDEMYDQAVALVAESRQASISMIQRRLRVGYNRAARMVEKMEREGVVGPADGVKGREVLIDPI